MATSLLRVTACVFVAGALISCGCTKRVPVAQLGDEGADVGVAVTLTDGAEIKGRLLSLTEREMVVEIDYVVGGTIELRGSGERRRLLDHGAPVAGEVIAVERDAGGRVARVERVVPLDEVAKATFHRSRSEVSTGAILSLFVGPAIGAVLALAI